MQVRTLASQVRLDARTKLLNPKWYEGMLSSGYEGVREIQKRLTNTMGWSATSGQVSPCCLLNHCQCFQVAGSAQLVWWSAEDSTSAVVISLCMHACQCCHGGLLPRTSLQHR